MIKQTQSKFLSVLLAAFTILFAMDCTCFAAAAVTQIQQEAAPVPSCHGHAAQPGDARDGSEDCCGKCHLERSAIIESAKVASSPAADWLYDPFLAAREHAHGTREESLILPLTRRDLLYQHLFGAHALPRSPPVI